MVGLAPVLDAAHISRNQFNDWMGLLRRSTKLLRTKFRATEPGVARDLSLENAIEIGFMAAVVRAGKSAEGAVPLVSEWIAQEKVGKLKQFIVFNQLTGESFEFDNFGRFHQLFGGIPDFEDDTGYSDRDRKPTKTATQVSIIDRGRIVADMKDLFRGEAA